MTILQEQFEKDFPDKSVAQIYILRKYEKSSFTNYDLDLREYKDLKWIELAFNKITSIDLSKQKSLRILGLNHNNLNSLDLSGCENLRELGLSGNKLISTSDLISMLSSKCKKLIKLELNSKNLTSINLSEFKDLKELNLCCNDFISVDFLNTIPNPEKLEKLVIHSNKIQPTDIEIFSKFVNLRMLKIGIRNKFYGSLKSWKNLTKLRTICIEATDVDEGLEYLPESLVLETKEWKYGSIQCSSNSTNAKCVAIQNQLRPFDYDVEAWQLAHPEKMLIARPEYFIRPDSREKWMTALQNKIQSSKEILAHLAQNEADKIAKITRLETQIKLLEATEQQLQAQIEQEREIHTAVMKKQDEWYRNLPPSEVNLKNILDNFAKEYLTLNKEKQSLTQENQQLKQNIEISNKLLEKEQSEKVDKATQTELTEETIQELREQINRLKIKK